MAFRKSIVRRSGQSCKALLARALSALALLGFAFGWTLPAGAAVEIVNRASVIYTPASGSGFIEDWSGEVRVVVPTVTGVSLTKSASNLTPGRNDSVTFTLNLYNAGSAAAPGVPVLVDGATRNLLIVRDAIPTNTTFQTFTAPPRGLPLYHVTGTPLHFYRTAPPARLSDVDAIAFGVADLAAGATTNFSFAVTINGNASGVITNRAHAYLNDGTGVPPKVIDSNPVRLDVTLISPFINFYRNSQFTTIQTHSRLGVPLFVQAEAALCNNDAAVAEIHIIYIISGKTGDRETFTAIETGTNTGAFRVFQTVPTRDGSLNPVVRENGIVETVRDDLLTAVIEGCGSASTRTTILIDPSGVVFDSKTDAPVPGARVTIYDVNTGLPAQVFDVDGLTPMPSSVITDSEGRYIFPVVPIGIYRLRVEPPAGYTAPSIVPPNQLSPSRRVSSTGSYGGNFNIDLSTGAVQVDIPVDPVSGPLGGLFIQKTASRTEAEIGDTVEYSLQVKNVSGQTLTDVVVNDVLPAGFTYLAGTTALDNAARPDPAGEGGPRLTFALGGMADNTTVTLRYRVRIGPGALQGTGRNSAQAVNRGVPRIRSNVAVAEVRINEGVFTSKGLIIGKVFVDLNTNLVQDLGEVGIPGVRIYLEDGSFAITDSEGKYSFYGVRTMTHVLKLDPTTLPRGARLEVLSSRNALDPGSRFVDLKFYEMHKANFAILPPSEKVMDAIKARREKDEVFVAEIDKGLKQDFQANGSLRSISDPRSLPAAGILDGASTNAVVFEDKEAPKRTNAPARYAPVLEKPMLNRFNSSLPGEPLAAPSSIPLERVVTNYDNTLDFIGLQDGVTLPMAMTTVRIKGPLGSRLALEVNGVALTGKQVGKAVEAPAQNLAAAEYIGVAFRPGTNRLVLAASDPFGNERARKVIQVIAPDKLGRLRIVLPEKDQSADGVTPAKITIKLEDASGVPVTASTLVTLDTTAGRWDVKDINSRDEGVQVNIEGGQGVFDLLPPQEPGDAKITASYGVLSDEATLPFLPDLRPMIANGLLEGKINISKLNASVLEPARTRDGFEEELKDYALYGNDDKARAAGRAAFFLKGKIKGDYLLTAGYDSEKGTRERLFRDIQPEEYYPVYGDSSVRGYDAQSTGRLYVRIDKKRSYLLYGDFNTGSEGNEARGLGNYNRSLTGYKEHYENNRVRANVWATQDSARQVVEELPANGTSGPYFFNVPAAIANSEKVEILTRDRNQRSLILEAKPMVRFTDYEFEPFTGRILFRGPVPSLDANLNPVSIRVTYEVDQGGEKFWTYGGDAQVKVHDRVEVGGAAVREENPQTGAYGLYSANSTVKLTKNTFLMSEVAQSQNELGGNGSAARAEVRHQSEKLDARVYGGKTEETFTNTASVMQPGRIEAGGKATYRLGKNTRLAGEAIVSEDVATGGSRKGIQLSGERSIGDYRVLLAGRHVEETAAPGSSSMAGAGTNATPNEINSLRTRLTAPMPFSKKRGSVYGEYENDLKETDRRMAAFGADYQMRTKGKFYARHEFISSLSGPYELNSYQQQNTTVAGFEREYMKDGTLFNEYRARDSFSGRESEAAIGLRNLWDVAEGLRLNTTFERVNPVSGGGGGGAVGGGGGGGNESTAATGAIEYTRNPDWKATARLELRTAAATESLLAGLGYARKVSKDWTLLTKSILMMQANESASGGSDRVQGRFQVGMAYRQTDTDRWSGLGKYEFRHEDDQSGGNAGGGLLGASSAPRRQVHILAMDVNYQPAPDWIISGHYAGKLAIEDTSWRRNDLYHAHLVGTRVSYDITKRFDVSLNANALFSGDFGSCQYGLGPEVGFVLRRNFRLGAGYNFFGFYDRDLSNDYYTNPGFYVSLRMKFDETLFDREKKKKD